VAGLASDSGATRVRVVEGCFGETPGGDSVLLHGLGGSPVRRSGVAAVAQRGGTAELSWRDG